MPLSLALEVTDHSFISPTEQESVTCYILLCDISTRSQTIQLLVHLSDVYLKLHLPICLWFEWIHPPSLSDPISSSTNGWLEYINVWHYTEPMPFNLTTPYVLHETYNPLRPTQNLQPLKSYTILTTPYQYATLYSPGGNSVIITQYLLHALQDTPMNHDQKINSVLQWKPSKI